MALPPGQTSQAQRLLGGSPSQPVVVPTVLSTSGQSTAGQSTAGLSPRGEGERLGLGPDDAGHGQWPEQL